MSSSRDASQSPRLVPPWPSRGPPLSSWPFCSCSQKIPQIQGQISQVFAELPDAIDVVGSGSASTTPGGAGEGHLLQRRAKCLLGPPAHCRRDRADRRLVVIAALILACRSAALPTRHREAAAAEPARGAPLDAMDVTWSCVWLWRARAKLVTTGAGVGAVFGLAYLVDSASPSPLALATIAAVPTSFPSGPILGAIPALLSHRHGIWRRCCWTSVRRGDPADRGDVDHAGHPAGCMPPPSRSSFGDWRIRILRLAGSSAVPLAVAITVRQEASGSADAGRGDTCPVRRHQLTMSSKKTT